MPGIYVDTSSLGRVLLAEPDRGAILEAFSRFDRRVASVLLRVELARLARRHDLLPAAEALVDGLALVPLDETVLADAGTMTPADVGTLDAIHLVTALRLAARGHVEALMTHDRQLAAAAEGHGLPVLMPA